MKTQHIKLAKKTVFVYKSIKDQNNFDFERTNPTGDQSHSIATNLTFAV